MSYIAIWCLQVVIVLPLYSINAKIKVEKWLGPIRKAKMEQSERIDQF
jgi:hypothetical protein